MSDAAQAHAANVAEVAEVAEKKLADDTRSGCLHLRLHCVKGGAASGLPHPPPF